MYDNELSVKGTDDKLLITILSPTWIDGNQSLQEYINANQKFLEKAKIIVDAQDIHIKSTELFELRNFLNENQITLFSILSINDETNKSASILGISNRTSEKTKPLPRRPGSLTTDKALLINKTIRSGICLDEESDIVIIGDVNPGSVIKSKGTILVWGKLMGEIHAGSSGDKLALVCALEMNPSILTIADVVYENSKKRKFKEPEIAYLDGNVLLIANWKKHPDKEDYVS